MSLITDPKANESITKMPNTASMSFWCLRKTLNGLAIEVYPSGVGVWTSIRLDKSIEARVMVSLALVMDVIPQFYERLV